MKLRTGIFVALSALPLLLATTAFARPSPQQPTTAAVAKKTAAPEFQGQTSQDYNQRLQQLARGSAPAAQENPQEDYRIGKEDLLQISVFEAPDLNRTVRVSADGEISLPLIGPVKAAGLTARQLEAALRDRLKATIMKDPHVGVFVEQMQSHPVSVFGAVKKPGVYQIREPKTLVEVLSMAQGLADDAGDSVIVMRGSDPADNFGEPTSGETGEKSIKVNLKALLQSGDPRYNVVVYPGDIVKVPKAGIVYVVGEVKKPGGFLLQNNQNISVLQALALAEGLTSTSAKGRARIIHTNSTTGTRTEIPINLGKILAGKAPDPNLQSNDIVFVPNSTGKSAFFKGTEAAVSIVGGVIIYRR